MSSEKNLKTTLLAIVNFAVLVLSAIMIVWITLDTFNDVDFMKSKAYMHFQFWVCMVFILDFGLGLANAGRKWHYFWRHLFFLLVSIPYLNLLHASNLAVSPDAEYFLRFIPLARAALAMSIVVGYMSANAVTSLCISYMTIIIFITYFCSLIFYEQESGVNPDVDSYTTALWWTAMDMTTVGSSISPVTPAGKIVAVILPICGMVMFPMFTVYLTNYVTGIYGQRKDDRNTASSSEKSSDTTAAS